MKTDFAPCSGYLIILKEGSEGAFIVPEPSPGDFVHADTGLCEIIRLPDLQRYAGGQWVQIGPGVLAKPDGRFYEPPGYAGSVRGRAGDPLPYLTSFGVAVVGIDVEYGFGCFA